MKEGPDIAALGALIGDPARANMLTALLTGKALTASELAQEAGVSAQTASSHLGRLQDGGMIRQVRQGRHRYYSLSGEDVGQMLEALMGVADRRGHTRTRTGPKDPALRRARVCYDHLAGELAVRMHDSLVQRKMLRLDGDLIGLTGDGRRFMTGLGIDVGKLDGVRRPLCKPCLDWSARRYHLAGGLGAALLARFTELNWMRRDPGTRVILVSEQGETGFAEAFPESG